MFALSLRIVFSPVSGAVNRENCPGSKPYLSFDILAISAISASVATSAFIGASLSAAPYKAGSPDSNSSYPTKKNNLSSTIGPLKVKPFVSSENSAKS